MGGQRVHRNCDGLGAVGVALRARLDFETFRKRFFGVVVEVDEFALGTRPHAHSDRADLELAQVSVRLAVWVLALEDQRRSGPTIRKKQERR